MMIAPTRSYFSVPTTVGAKFSGTTTAETTKDEDHGGVSAVSPINELTTNV